MPWGETMLVPLIVQMPLLVARMTMGARVDSRALLRTLTRSPRFRSSSRGFRLELSTEVANQACLVKADGTRVGCYAGEPNAGSSLDERAALLARGMHNELFSLGFEFDPAQLAVLRGSSVIMQSQNQPTSQATLRNLRSFQ